MLCMLHSACSVPACNGCFPCVYFTVEEFLVARVQQTAGAGQVGAPHAPKDPFVQLLPAASRHLRTAVPLVEAPCVHDSA